MSPPLKIGWNYSITAEDLWKNKGKIGKDSAGNRYFFDVYNGKETYFPVMDRDTPILGKVLAPHHDSYEAIFVSEQSEALNGLLKNIKRNLSYVDKYGNKHFKQGPAISEAVFKEVANQIPYDLKKSDEIVRKKLSSGSFTISIGEFIRGHAGVCRHQAITCAALLEMLKNDPDFKIQGFPHINRNHVKNLETGISGGHAWARYDSAAKDESGKNLAYILDVAQQQGVLLLNDPMIQNLIAQKKIWNYNQPDETFY